LREVETRYGRLVIPDSETDIVSRFLAQYGEWAELEVEFVAGALPEGAAVADIGAFIGTFGLALQRRKTLRNICFVEANRDIVPVLEENVRRNCPIPFTVVDALVAPRDFSLKRGLRDMHNIGSASFVARSAQSLQVTVPIPKRRMTLGELDSTYGPFDLVKLDTEGMELVILTGEAGIVERENTAFWLECNEHENSLALAEYLLAHRRSLYYFAYPSFRPDNLHGVQTPIFPFAYEAGLLAPSAGSKILSGFTNNGCILRPIANREDLRTALWHTPRWAPHDWWNLPTQEVVALATHQLTGEDFENFLVAGDGTAENSASSAADGEFDDPAKSELIPRKGAMAVADARARFHRTEQTLRRANAWAKQLAADRLALLRVERELRLEAEALLRAEGNAHPEPEPSVKAERELRLQAEAALVAITTSTSWRALNRLQALLTKMPAIRRRLGAVAARVLRGRHRQPQ
jgi:FkbM family methyltransferase